MKPRPRVGEVRHSSYGERAGSFIHSAVVVVKVEGRYDSICLVHFLSLDGDNTLDRMMLRTFCELYHMIVA